MNVLPATRRRNDAAHREFDPLARVYVAQAARPAAIEPVEAAALEALQRALLVIDGTVTQFIEAWALEPVDVLRLDQHELRLTEADPWLALDAGADVMRRQVMLCGAQSGRFFAWADSRIATGRIDADLRRGLQSEGGGIGRILIDAGLESRREPLWFGRDRPADVPPEVSARHPGEFLVRSYRLLVAGRPLMLITERFPL
ncbi:MAG: chorismate pyruvate-lyase family protein [Gammaproteobacteria bacterium]|nr:MAG: chorismate pyruvate-lyase family protein [Gammaproteobacteria bacterium]